MNILRVPTPELVKSSQEEWEDWERELYSPQARTIEISAYNNIAHPRLRWKELALLAGAAPTSFELDGMRYASVDSFHYSLKFPEGEKRNACARASAMEAREMTKRERAETFIYRGSQVAVGSAEHRALFARAILAKLAEHSEVEDVLRKSCWSKLQFPHSLREWQGENPGVQGLVTPVVYMIERAKRWGPPSNV